MLFRSSYASVSHVQTLESHLLSRRIVKLSFGAAGESEDFMVMNRNYERDEEDDSLISDLSTYIDPSKYNQIFDGSIYVDKSLIRLSSSSSLS